MRRERPRRNHRQRHRTFSMGSILRVLKWKNRNICGCQILAVWQSLLGCQKVMFSIKRNRNIWCKILYAKYRKVSKCGYTFLKIFPKNIDIISDILILYRYFLGGYQIYIYLKNIHIISDILILYRYFFDRYQIYIHQKKYRYNIRYFDIISIFFWQISDIYLPKKISI